MIRYLAGLVVIGLLVIGCSSSDPPEAAAESDAADPALAEELSNEAPDGAVDIEQTEALTDERPTAELLVRSELPFVMSDDGKHVAVQYETQYYIVPVAEIPDRELIEPPPTAVRYPDRAEAFYNFWSAHHDGIILQFGSGLEGDRNEIELFRIDGSVETVRRPSVGAQLVLGEFADGSFLLWRYPFEGVDEATTPFSRLWLDGTVEAIETPTEGIDLSNSVGFASGERIFGFARAERPDADYPKPAVVADGEAFWVDATTGEVGWVPGISTDDDDPYFVSPTGLHFITQTDATTPVRPWFGNDRAGPLYLRSVDSGASIELVADDGEQPLTARWSPSGDRIALGFGVSSGVRDAPMVRIVALDDVLDAGGLAGVDGIEIEIDRSVADDVLGTADFSWRTNDALRYRSDQAVYHINIPDER